MTDRFKNATAAEVADSLEHGGASIDEVTALCARTIELLREYAAAPAPSDAQDAARWRALLNSQRVRPLGNAGVSQPEANHYAHLGLELWTIFGKSASTDRLRATLVKENALGREWLTKYADIAIESQK
jgi:hypothetical protein